MGRDKSYQGVKTASGIAASEPAARQGNSCGICSKEVVVQEEQHISGHCSKCGQLPFHTDCVQYYLERILRPQIREGGYGTRAWEKAYQKIKQRPQDMFAANGTSQRLRQPCPACPDGVIEAAEVMKPPRKLTPAPPPPVPKQCGPQQQAQVGIPKKPPAPKKPLQQQQAAPARQLGSRNTYPTRHAATRTQSSGCGNAHFPGRPAWLQMCRDQMEDGACYTYSCEYCHSREEQQEREAEYAEELREAARQRRQAELEEHRKKEAAQVEETARKVEAEVAAAAERERQQRQRQEQLRRDVVAREEAALQLSYAALSLMKQHKRKQCIAALAELGFDASTSAAAADATGCEPEAAASLLMEGDVAGSPRVPASVIREAREVLAAAASLSLPPPAVEAALVVAAGDWKQAEWELKQQARLAAEAQANSTARTAGTEAVECGTLSTPPQQVSRPASVGSSSAAPPYAHGYGQGDWGSTAHEPSSRDASTTHGTEPQQAAEDSSWSSWQHQDSYPQQGVAQAAGTAAGPQEHDPGYDAGFAAGLAAALAATGTSDTTAAAPNWQQAGVEQQGAYAGGWLPMQMDRPQPAEEEIDDLMSMLGIA